MNIKKYITLITISILMSNNSKELNLDKDLYQDSIDTIIKELLADTNKVPDFTLLSYKGESYNMRSLEGKVILLNFWATWCGPCRMEIPELNEMQKKYSKDDFSEIYKVDYPLLYGAPNELEKILLDYGGIYSVPTSILVNKKGEAVFNYPGAILKSYDIYDGVYSTLNNKILESIKE